MLNVRCKIVDLRLVQNDGYVDPNNVGLLISQHAPMLRDGGPRYPAHGFVGGDFMLVFSQMGSDQRNIVIAGKWASGVRHKTGGCGVEIFNII